MKHRWIIISLSVIFFLTALTFWANRIYFPTVIHKIAIEEAQKFLKRKIEIESLRFNWLKGVVLNNVKVYQKESSTEVLVEAEKVSIGLIFIPGFKQHTLILPFINIQSPSLHLIHQANGQWNFSDLLSPAATANEKPSPLSISVGSIHLLNGKIRLDDVQPQGLWTEFFDQINLKVGLSYKGISFDGSLTLPKKDGMLSVNGSYQPLNQSLNSALIIKNIKPLDYLKIIPVQLPFTLTSGTINDLNAHLDYSKEKINVQGAWSIKNIDMNLADQNIKADIDALGADISLEKGKTLIKGDFSFAKTKITTPTYSITGSFKSSIDHFVMNSPEDITIKASLQTDNITVQLPHNQSFQGQINALISMGHLQKDSASLEGNLSINQTFLSLGDKQNITGHLTLNNIKLIKDKNIYSTTTDLRFNNFNLQLPGQMFKGELNASNLTIHMDAKNNIKIQSPLELTNLGITTDNATIKGALLFKSIKAMYDQNNQTIDAQTQGTLDKFTMDLGKQGTLHTNAHFDMHILLPIKNPSGLDYKGSLAIEEARFEGLPLGTIKDINLTADLSTDTANIQNLSFNLLDTPIKAKGSITNFLKPQLNMQAESSRFDLNKIKDIAPDLLKAYGLTIDGESSFNLKFEGPLNDPLNAKINALATLKDVNIQSSTLKQSFNNISAILKADGDSISWHDFTATIMDKPFVSTGDLTNFKNPKINASLSWQGIEIKTKIYKDDNLINIQDLDGHYQSATFSANGTVDLSSKLPQLDLKSILKIKLEDLTTILPNLKKDLDPLKLSGLVTANTTLTGSASDWKNWTLKTSALSELITVYGFKFNNFNGAINQEEGKIKKFNITSKFYDGDLNILTTADIRDTSIPFNTALHIENVNLEKLIKDTGAKDEDLRGFIALTTVVNGTIKDILNIKGNGSLNISQGYLMKKEFSSLFVISELSNLIFTDATANFEIANQEVSTDNFMLKSEGAILNGKGTIGFNHKIQFELHPEFNTEAISQSDSFKKGPSALIASVAGKYLTINISGTLDKPQIHTIKHPTEFIKKTGEIITENVGQILQGIFQ